jgi:cell division protein FtsL
MQKAVLVLLIVLAPVLFVANVWQAYRFDRIEGHLRTVEREHLRILEENKRLIVGIAGLRSPARVRELAEKDLGLEAAPADRVERIRFEREWSGSE